MSWGVISIATSAVLAICIAVLYAWKKRQESAVSEFAQQVWQLTREASVSARMPNGGRPDALGGLSSAVNKLLENLEQRDARMHDREQLFQRLVETVHDAVLVTRKNILFANSRFLSLLSTSAENVVGKPLTDFVAPEYVDLVEQNFRRRLAGEPAAERYEVELVGAQGQITRVELSSTVVVSAGEPVLLLTALEMLPPAAEPVAPARSRALATLDAMSESVITVDTEGRIEYVNAAAVLLLGQSADQVIGRQFEQIAGLVDEADRRSLGDPVRKALSSRSRVTVSKRALLVPVNGTAERSVEISVSPLRLDGSAVVGVVIVLHDISELRGLTRQMSYQASHDALTGLVNRREFERRLSEALDSALTGDVTHALCYMDLDRFKVVNDTCGHTAGDNMLREVASLIKEAVRDSDTVGRIGGDEFALLLVGCPLEKARQIADDVVRSVNGYRFVWKDRIFNVGISVGLVEIGRDGATIEDLINAADSACYVAKKQGGVHVHVYSAREEASARLSGEMQWLQTLQSALRDNKFELYFQPIVHARSRRSARSGIRSFRAPARRKRSGRRVAVGFHPRRRAPPPDAAHRPLGRTGRTIGARPRRFEAAARAQRRDQHRRANLGRRRVSRVRRRLFRSCRSRARRHLFRDHGERRGREHGSRAPIHRSVARYGLRIRVGRFRQRLELLHELKDFADGLSENRRLIHSQPRRRHREPGDGRGDDRVVEVTEFSRRRGTHRRPRFVGCGEADGHRFRTRVLGRPAAAVVDHAGASVGFRAPQNPASRAGFSLDRPI